MFDYCVNEYNEQPTLVVASQLSPEVTKANFLFRFSSAPYMVVPATIDDFKKLHKRKFWYNLKRTQKLFCQEHGGVSFKILELENDLHNYLPKVFALFRKRWSGKYTSCSWKTPKGEKVYSEAMLNLAQKKKAFLAVLLGKDDKLLSFGYCLTDETTVYFYQHAVEVNPEYKRFSLGKIFLSHLLENIVLQKRFARFDFMIGNQAYKQEWATGEEQVFKLFLRQKDFSSRIILFFRYFAFFLAQLIARKKVLRAMAEQVLVKLRGKAFE